MKKQSYQTTSSPFTTLQNTLQTHNLQPQPPNLLFQPSRHQSAAAEMVEFHSHIISDLLDDPTGGLVILSSGLSLPKLLSSLLSLHHPSQGTLLLLSLSSSLKSHLHLHLPEPITEITAELPSHHRVSLYSSGQVLSITPRILIVDLLTNKLPSSSLSSLILLNVHALAETSTESFIVRILKSFSPSLPIYAFTDRPHSMVAGFCKAERLMKALFIKRLHLWPRFQVYVSQELEKDPPEVVDVRVPMSKYMVGIQKAIMEVMDACLKEMRKSNKVDVEDLTVENGLFKSFDEIVRRQLDPIWHTLGKKTKQLVSDLKTLRKLLDYLVRYDAVSYLKYLETLRVSESYRSVWIFAESSYKIFDFAKKRVYRLSRSKDLKLEDKRKKVTGKKRKSKRDDDDDEAKDNGAASTSTNNEVVLEEILEEAPKWKVLREILEEIEEERQKKALSVEEDLIETEEADNGIVLVACKDECSCMQVEDCITNGPQKVLREEWEKYLLSKVELRSFQVPQKKKSKPKPKGPKGFGVLDGVVPVTTVQNSDASSINRQEYDALLAAASVLRNQCKKDSVAGHEPLPPVNDKELPKGRGKGRNKKGRANSLNSGNTDSDNTKGLVINDKPEISGKENEDKTGESNIVIARDHHEGNAQRASEDKGVLWRHNEDSDTARFSNGRRLPPVQFYALESDQPILDVLQPSVIIVYHPDMTFVREIEVYKAENPSKKLKVYFLFYDDSTEVQKFEASIRRENAAFESLIRQKSLMMIPVDQNGHCLGLDSYSEPVASSSQNSITRKAGGRKEVEKEMQVIVDMREFMSSLPNVLHRKGMKIIPVTLEVGDYILSPLICVERKSIQDLFGSFTSGRLYNQVEMMVRYYRIPVLLIEFSQDKSFSFQSASDISDDVTPNNIISKLSLLALHFPRLRILWSRSLHATAEIFASLKANQDEPDEIKAIRVGIPSEEGIIENDVRAENYNTSAVEFLRRLPGVTDSNYRAIMEGCKSLSELALLPLERLSELMGGQKAARTLRDFLDAKYPTLL